jgi:hypothetical protein
VAQPIFVKINASLLPWKKAAQKCTLLLKFKKKNCTYKTIAQQAKIRPIRDQCYDFLNIFADKFGEKISVFDSKQS